jgi:DUF917 family protein
MSSFRIGLRDVASLARGCAFLSCGGGGELALAELLARGRLGESGPVPVVDLEKLEDDSLVMSCGMMGTPLVFEERLLTGDEPFELLRAVEREHGKSVAAVMPFLLAGANGLISLGWASALGLPLVDADGMERPKPRLITAMGVAGVPATPACLVDGAGGLVTIRVGDRSRFVEAAIAATSGLGGVASIAFDVMDAATARRSTVRSTVSRALSIGRAGGAGRPIVAAMTASAGGRELGHGRVVDVESRTAGARAYGTMLIDSDTGLLRVIFREEYLLAIQGGRSSAATPEIITVLDAETGWPISVDDVRRGQLVTVVATPCDPVWHTAAGLAVAGPEALGLPMGVPAA